VIKKEEKKLVVKKKKKMKEVIESVKKVLNIVVNSSDGNVSGIGDKYKL